jgi:hypothetical protein
MAISLDTSTNSGAKAAVSTFNWLHTVSGNGRIIVVGVGMRDATAGDMVLTSVTYAGFALTKLRADVVTVDTSFRSEIWYLIAPPTGSNSIVVTSTGTVEVSGGSASSFNGVHQISPVAGQGGATGLTLGLSCNVITAIDKAWIMDVLYSRSATITVNAAQTEITNLGVNTNDDRVGSSYKSNVAAITNTMDWTESNDGNDWAMSAIALRPSHDLISSQNNLRPKIFAPGNAR